MNVTTKYWDPVGGELFLHSHIYESDSGAERLGWDQVLKDENLELARDLVELDDEGGTEHDQARLGALQSWLEGLFVELTPMAEGSVRCYAAPWAEHDGAKFVWSGGWRTVPKASGAVQMRAAFPSRP